MFADDEDDSRDVSDDGRGEDLSSLKGESLMPADMGEGEGDTGLRAGAGDLLSLGLLSRGLSPLFCCFACCRHFALRFLNQTWQTIHNFAGNCIQYYFHLNSGFW